MRFNCLLSVTAWVLSLFICTVVFAAEDRSTPKARGLVVARQHAMLSSEIAARVLTLPRREGETFNASEVLATFDCRLFEAQREKVRAERDAARKKLENNQRLAVTQSIGVLEVALSESEVAKAEAEFTMTDLNVQRCAIAAPYNGRVLRVMANEHDSVRQQQEILEIVDLASLEMEIIVPSLWLTWLRQGTKLMIHIDETGASLPATLSTLGASVDAVSQTVRVRARFDALNERLIPGMSGTAKFSRLR